MPTTSELLCKLVLLGSVVEQEAYALWHHRNQQN
jgi:hypothetical protein